MTAESQALDTLSAFVSVGAQAFDLTLTDLHGKKPPGGYLSNRSAAELSHAIGAILSNAAPHQHNVILRPRKNPRAELIQLDDLKPEDASRLAPFAFLVLSTSPGNCQAWIAVSDSVADFARRLRKGVNADPTASGATRIAGHPNFKSKYAPSFPTVEITISNPGRIVTRAELETSGFVAPPEPAQKTPVRVSPTYTGRRKWPSYQRCVRSAPPAHGGELRPDISRADFAWCMTAIDWGWSIEDTAARLLQESAKAQENGESYAITTAQNAAAAVERRKAQAR